MNIKISDHFTYSRLLRFTLSPIIMMVFSSIYSVVDGIFVSNIAGKGPLASINIVWPLIMIIGAFGFMLGTGGSAEIAKTIGEGQHEKAQEYVTTVTITIAVIGISLAAVCFVFIQPIMQLMGASDALMADCITYGRIMMIGTPFFMLQASYHSLLSTAEKPKIGMWLTILCGCLNMVGDYLLIAVFKMGVLGAGCATAFSYIVGGIIPTFYFFSNNSSLLRFRKTKFYGKMLLNCCTNGISEMITNMSSSVVMALFNIQLMKIIGEDGVSAISIIMYVDFAFKAVMFGFCIGTGPIVSYHYGAGNREELKNLFRMLMTITTVTTIVMFCSAFGLSEWLTSVFVNASDPLFEITLHGFRLYSICYIFANYNILGSALFTSLCNGLLSGIISFARSLALPIVLVLLLPELIQLDGIWLTSPIAEALTVVCCFAFIVANRKKYGYA